MINIVEIKGKIRKIENKTHGDVKVLAVVDSFFGCSDDYIKANLATKIVKYAPCKAWEIAMSAVYQ